MNKDSDQGHTLLEAAKENRLEDIQQILQKHHGQLSIVSDPLGNTALHWAVINNQPEIVDLLLIYRFSKNLFNKDLCTPVVLAAELNHWSCVEIFAKHQKSGNTQGLNTALLHAVKEKQFLTAKNLLQNGAPCNAIWTRTQFSALHWAVENDDALMIELLLKNNADQCIEDNADQTPLKRAWHQGKWSCVIALCQQADLPQKDYNEALMYAVKTNHYSAVDALLKAGADPNALKSQEGYSPLHWAVVNDSPEIFALLLAHNARLDCYDNDHYTPVHLAFKLNRVNLAYWFTPLQIDLSIKDNSTEQISALEASSRWRVTDFRRALNDTSKEVSEIRIAIAQGNTKALSQYLQDKPNLEAAINDSGQTVLEYAMSIQRLDVIQLIASQFQQDPALEKCFTTACQQGNWSIAQTIDRERALAYELDQKFQGKLAWYSLNNTQVKTDFMQQAEHLVEKYDCDRARLFNHLAKSQTATYRQLLFWKGTTNTSLFFNEQASYSEKDGPEQVVIAQHVTL